MKRIGLLILIITLSLFISGCKQDNMENIEIIVTNYPNEYITENIYGKHATISSIYPDGVNISNYEITKKQKKDYAFKDLFVYNGQVEKERKLAVELLDLNPELKIIDAAYVLESDYSGEDLWLNPSSLLMMSNNIRMGLNEYITSSYLKKEVTNVIYEEIIEYQNKIIKMLNPNELRKNPYTKNKQAFIEWLQEEVARCEKRLNKRVEDAAVSVSRHYISDLDNICVELKNMVEERETILSERDRFYGTLMKSKGTVATRTQQAVTQSHKEYMSLLDASEELWNSLWNERYKYDRNVVLTTTGSTVAGAITGGVLGVVAANTAATAGAVVAATGGTIMVAAAGVGILIFGTAALFAGKKLAESIFEGKLNENSSKYILEFKETLKNTRIQMEDEVCKRLDYLFESELISMDRSFMEFRSTTNIDSLNLPLLEKEIQKMNDLVGIITEEESIYGYS